MRPTQCVGGLYLTVVDSLAPLPINNNNKTIFRRSPMAENKKDLRKFSARFLAFSTVQKMCCPVAEDRAIFEDLRVRDQDQGLENVSSRTSSKPRTSSRTPPLIKTFLVFISNLEERWTENLRSAKAQRNVL